MGIINLGKLVAEGSPADLKHSIGADIIVATIEGDAEAASHSVSALEQVEQVEVHENTVTISVSDGVAAMGDVAVALSQSGARVKEVTLRTPTLDDVFLQATGARLHDTALTAARKMNALADPSAQIQARKAGFVFEVAAVARRALRATSRDLESVVPALIIPVFFFAVNVGALQDLAETLPGLDYKAFQLPVAIIFAVTGVSRAYGLVLDIQSGYFDKLSLTPVNRLALLLGHMVADFALVVALTLPVVALGFIVGVRFESGWLGVIVFVLISGTWGLIYTGFPYAIAFKTGNPAAVNTSFLLFFPFAFLTTAFLPKEAMTGWLSAVATYNPVTYLLEGLRSLLITGWDGMALLKGLGAVGGVGFVSISLALLTLRGRTQEGVGGSQGACTRFSPLWGGCGESCPLSLDGRGLG